MDFNVINNPMLSLTLRQIEYALAIARTGSVTAAAAQLHVSQPALSNALAEVERQLARPLFLRRAGAAMRPTVFGREWLAAAEPVLAGAQALARGVVQRAALRLAVFEDLAALHLAPVLGLLAEAQALEAPRPPPQPVVLGFEALDAALAEGRADVALTWELGLSASIATRPLARVAPRAVLAPDHPLAGRTHLRLADLAGAPLVLTDQGLSIAHMRALFARLGLAPLIAHRVASPDLMRAYAARGLGVGLAYTHPHRPEAPDGSPVVLREVVDAGRESLVLAWRADEQAPLDAAQIAAIERHFSTS